MSRMPSSIRRDDFLIVGYGNTLRGDDGAGPRVAEAVAALNYPGARALACALLTPELADPISQARAVLFVDAAVDAPREVRLRKIEPAESAQIMSHAAGPAALLALARDVFGRAPEAWWLTIPAVKFDFGGDFSPQTQQGIARALEKIESLCRQKSAGASPRPDQPGQH
jgi:hydrogenase maturation protease